MSIVQAGAMAAGVGLLAAASFCAPNVLESTLRGTADGSLAWGPTLFRVLLVFHGVVLICFAILRKPSRHEDVPSEVNPSSTSTATWFALLLLCLAASTLRLWKLGTCLWYDEVTTVLDFIRPPAGMILTSFPSQNQHMLYSLMAHASIVLFGDNDAAVRIPAVLFGVGSIVAVFMLGRSVFSDREGLLAATLMTFSYHHVWFSQSARGYSGLLFFSTLAVWLWMEARRRDNLHYWIAYIFAVTLGLWIHMTMIFVLAGQGLVYLASLTPRGRDTTSRSPVVPLIAWLLSATLTLQLYALSLPEFLRTALHEVSLPGDWTSPFWLVTETIRSFHLGPAAIAVVIVGMLICFAGWFSLLHRHPSAAVQMTVPPILGGTAMIVLAHNLWPRFFFFAMGFALLLAVHGVFVCAGWFTGWFGRQQWGKSIATALLLLAVAGSSKLLPRCFSPPKQDFTGARDYVDAHRKSDEAVAAVGLAGRVFRDYYAPQWHAPATLEELKALQARSPRLWLVYTLPMHLKTYLPDIWKETESQYRPIMTFTGTLGGGDIVVCRPLELKAPSPTASNEQP